jgi:5-methylcytosine-specific restriction endonuclease McrA
LSSSHDETVESFKTAIAHERKLMMVAAVIERPTLVLNRNWQPVGVQTVARALVKLFSGTARVVDPADYQQYTWDDWARLNVDDDDVFVQTTGSRLRVPEVIVLTTYDRVPNAHVTFSRRNIYKRDKSTCQYCGTRPGVQELTIDHILPRSQGGISSWENCVLACIDCNSRKADRTPEQARMPLRQAPQRPRWRPAYALRGVRIDSWARFVSESYWNVELES